ncbi:MAG: calpastatin [Spirosoma sp.]|nr:calpastatin [Spirosoma sp.]
MRSENNLNRFLDAQETDYSRALAEIKNGRKQSHWMWYIFPQIAGLGYSDMATFYAIKDLQEASDYLAHPVLGSRLIDISSALLSHTGKTANQIMGSPDDLKLRSSMTLFSLPENTDPVFQAVLDKFFNGIQDPKTLGIIRNNT